MTYIYLKHNSNQYSLKLNIIILTTFCETDNCVELSIDTTNTILRSLVPRHCLGVAQTL